MTRPTAVRRCYKKSMHRGLVLLAAISPGLLGCADMLGLGGLTYDQSEETEQTGGTSSAFAGGGPASGGAGAIIGSGGLGAGGTVVSVGASSGSGAQPGSGAGPGTGPREPVQREYFIDVGPGALLAATYPGVAPLDGAQAGWGGAAGVSPPNSWAYILQPASQKVQIFRLEEAQDDWLGSSSVLGADAESATWTHLRSPLVGARSELLAYDATRGLAYWGPAPEVDGPFLPAVRAGSPGWTHMVLAGPADAPLLVSYNQRSGTFRLGPADLDAEDPLVSSGSWQPGLTDLVPFARAGVPGVLKLAADSDDQEFLPLVDGKFGPSEPVTVPAGAWDHALVFPGDESPVLLLYSEAVGIVSRLEFAGGSPSPSEVEEGTWRTGLDQLLPVFISGRAWILVYDSASGILDLKDPWQLDAEFVVK